MAASSCKHASDVVEFFDDSEAESDTFSIENTTWKRLEEQKHKEGYRDGVEAGEEAALQGGHDDGYQQTSGLFHLAKLRGSIAAMHSYLSSCGENLTPSASLMADIDSLEAEVRQLEQELTHSILSSKAIQHGSHHSERTTYFAEPSLLKTNTPLTQLHDSSCSDIVDDRTTKADTSQFLDLHADETDKCAVDFMTMQTTDTFHHECQEEFVMPVNCDIAFPSAQHLSQYKSCCSKLEQLVNGICVSIAM